MKTRTLLPLILVALLTGCSTPLQGTTTSSPIPTVPARLRITNASQFMLDRVVVGFPNEEIIFSAVPAGATTDYQPVQHGVYDNVAYQVTINDKFIEQPVIDWVGAEPLPGTSFTFVLSIRPPSGLEEAPSGLVIETEVRQD